MISTINLFNNNHHHYGQDQREWEKHLKFKSNLSNNTRNWIPSNISEWVKGQKYILKIWNIYIHSVFIITHYFPMLQNGDEENSPLQNWWIIDLEDLQSKSFRINLYILRIVKEHDSRPIFPSSALSPSSIDCNDGRSTSIISFKYIQYSQLWLIRIHEMPNYLM